eukprot:m.107185 g.107185  ORF g.107185 m.107185 type:complete len:500 (-) comp8971_c0_seq9:146-1645(-)
MSCPQQPHIQKEVLDGIAEPIVTLLQTRCKFDLIDEASQQLAPAVVVALLRLLIDATCSNPTTQQALVRLGLLRMSSSILQNTYSRGETSNRIAAAALELVLTLVQSCFVGQDEAVSLGLFQACVEILEEETTTAFVHANLATLASMVLDRLMQGRPQLQRALLAADGMRLLTSCCAGDDPALQKAAALALVTVSSIIPTILQPNPHLSPAAAQAPVLDTPVRRKKPRFVPRSPSPSLVPEHDVEAAPPPPDPPLRGQATWINSRNYFTLLKARAPLKPGAPTDSASECAAKTPASVAPSIPVKPAVTVAGATTRTAAFAAIPAQPNTSPMAARPVAKPIAKRAGKASSAPAGSQRPRTGLEVPLTPTPQTPIRDVTNMDWSPQASPAREPLASSSRPPARQKQAAAAEAPAPGAAFAMTSADMRSGAPPTPGIARPTPARSGRRRIRRDFTGEELRYLISGVERYGTRWIDIRSMYSFHPSRTASDLKEKWARMQGRK